MRVVLVNPMVTIAGWGSFYKAGQTQASGRALCSLPHGLLHLATELNRAGHQCSVIDLRCFEDMAPAVTEIIRRKPHVVGCGAMTVDFTHLVELFHHLKQCLPEATTVAGGVHVSVAPQDAEREDCIDYIVTGEAEWTLTKMLDARLVGYPRVIKGEPPDLNLLLPIDRELVDYRNGELEHGVSWKAEAPYVTVMTSRGCPYRCAFCHPVSDTMFGNARQRSVANVINECKWLKWRYGARYYEFIDDYFTHQPGYVAAFCEAWKAHMENTPFNVATRADTIVKHPTMFEELKAVGLHTVNVGFESGSDYVLKFLRKGTTAEMNRQAGQILNRLGTKIIANVMFGIPGESLDDSWATIKMIREMKADCIGVAYFTPYPGCELHEKYKDELVSHDTSKMDRYATGAKLKGVDYEPLQKLVQTELMRHLQPREVANAS